MRRSSRRRVCFVTGTRAEFGLMRSTLEAIRANSGLELQLVVTGMHIDRSRGGSVEQIRAGGWKIDRMIPWPAAGSEAENARYTGAAMSRIADAISDLKSEVILVVGDRVEAFAAAAAGHIAGCVVAHVHGGDRALGQVDDSLRHAITKLAHVHFPATARSARRILKLGEDASRIRLVGSPGLDDLLVMRPPPPRGRAESAERRPGSLPSREKTAGAALADSLCPGVAEGATRTALVVLHPVDPDARVEHARAAMVFRAVRTIGFDRVDIVYPNTDPGATGIVRCWDEHADDSRVCVFPDLPRDAFLGRMREAAVLVGNSSSGIIEAASFGTPVVDVGPRQRGRERSQNVTNVPYSEAAIRRALKRIWNNGRPKRFRGRNVYGGGGAGLRIARVLAGLKTDDRTRRKLIAY